MSPTLTGNATLHRSDHLETAILGIVGEHPDRVNTFDISTTDVWRRLGWLRLAVIDDVLHRLRGQGKIVQIHNQGWRLTDRISLGGAA